MLKLPVISRFLDALDAERNFSPHTVRSYATDLLQFCRFLAAGEAASTDQPPPADDLPVGVLKKKLLAVTPMDVRAYLVMMRNGNYSKSTIARKLASLRSFYKYLVRTNVLAIVCRCVSSGK